jgi:hypothetical protein
MHRFMSLRSLVGATLFGVALAAPTMGASAATISINACGTVNAYVAATALLDGQVTVGGVPIVIAAGADIHGTLQLGANACLSAVLDAKGRAASINVGANAAAAHRRT